MLLLSSARSFSIEQLCFGKISSNIPRELLQKTLFTDVIFTNSWPYFLEANVIQSNWLWLVFMKNVIGLEHDEQALDFFSAVKLLQNGETTRTLSLGLVLVRTYVHANSTDAQQLQWLK